jgi:hypothetical protein
MPLLRTIRSTIGMAVNTGLALVRRVGLGQDV